jgi:hypothetical protein
VQEPNNFCLHFAFFILDGLFRFESSQAKQGNHSEAIEQKNKHFAKKALGAALRCLL